MNKFSPIITALGLVFATVTQAAELSLHTFRKVRLNEHFWAEGATFGDFNRDGKMDIVAGPFWYEGPDFKTRHEYYPATQTFKRAGADGKEEAIPGFEGALGTKNTYSDNFFAFVRDFDGDGWSDILIYGFPGKDASWFENPQGKDGAWKRHRIFEPVDNESPTFADIDADGKPEIVCNSGGFFGYAAQESSDPTQPWKFHAISPPGKWAKFTHGLGVGDVTGDGKPDIIEAGGVWEQPASLAGDPVWKKHAAPFGNGAQFYAYDVNADGLPDVIGSLAAHGYGLAWWEQVREGGVVSFRRHLIMGEKPEDNRYGVVFSQLHAIDLVDMDGDGLKDIVVGKRFWAHGPQGDPEPNAAAVVYWFQLVRKGKDVDFVPHRIDDDSGVGTQLVTGDVNGDGLLDVLVANKKGAFVHLHEKKAVSEAEWAKAQPKANPAFVENTAPLSAPALAKPAPALASGANLPTGTLPLGENGKPLNLDFEDGTLRDWSATGDAFNGQPVRGPIDQTRKFGSGKVANHQGEFWIGGYEKLEDKPQGTLTSAPFKATQPWASFRLGATALTGTRIELVRADTQEVFFTTRGRSSETMTPTVVDLQPLKDKEIFIRIVDSESGGWGHVNFDDFRFHAQKPVVAAPAVAQAAQSDPVPKDTIKFAGLKPEEAAKAMTLPPGFRAQLFAGEPDVQQPVAFALDDRGRLWVAEAYSYPIRQPEGQGKDRIVVLEDQDGDGTFDRRTVFVEGLNLVSGLEVGFGGVWVGAAPYLMFIPIADGDAPKPAGEPKILLDGWGYGDTHETMNTFSWGPDGWLYGCHGVFTHSVVGKPGTAEDARVKINAGIWRYHPTQHRFEVFAEGTSNPWGLDFNEYGHAIIEACVIPHLWHIVQGAHYTRQAGQHFNPHLYGNITTIADHAHFAGKTPHGGNGRSDSAGGGHAHAGLMVYLGGSWPEKYRGQAFMNNIHGARINMDILEPKGSGYVGKHGADFIFFNDAWSQIVNLQYDQDGSLYLIDWYDKQQCHTRNVGDHDRANGRIFKVVYGETKTTAVDMTKLNDSQLITEQLKKQEWRVRHARRILQERATAGKVGQLEISFLRSMLGLEKGNFGTITLNDPKGVAHALESEEAHLRLLWTLHVVGGLREEDGLKLLQSKHPHVRAWTVQLLCENLGESDIGRASVAADSHSRDDIARKRAPSPAVLDALVRLARQDESPVVRLYLTSAAQRLAPEQRWDILAALQVRGEDAGDHNLPLLNWYAFEPLVVADYQRALKLAFDSKLPRTLEFTARRAASLNLPNAMNAVVATLARATDDERRLAMLTGVTAALQGQRTAPLPAGWDRVETNLAASANAAIRSQTQGLSLTFGSASALTAAREMLSDKSAGVESRQRALAALLNVKDAHLPPLLLQLVNEPALRAAAIRGLAAFNEPKTPTALLAVYATLPENEKRDVLLTLVSRTAFAQPLLTAIAENRVPVRDLSAEIARQLRGLNQPDLTAQLDKVWGVTRESPADKLAAKAKYKLLINNPAMPKPDPSRGRALFAQTCAACHTLFGEGGKIGPDITGSNRADLDYLLHNILDPNAEIPNAYRTAMIELKDGRVLAGVANQQDPKVVSVVTPNETLTLPRSEIKALTMAEMSMMPEGLLTPWSERDVRDLIAYLRSPAQVPLPAK